MRSIRQHLILWLGLSLGLLWLAAGTGVYLLAKRSMIANFDAEMKSLASDAPMIELLSLLPAENLGERFGLDPGLGPLAELAAEEGALRFADFFEVDSGLYFQAWDIELGEVVGRSESLGALSLVLPPVNLSHQPTFWRGTLTSGETVRLLGMRVFRGRPLTGFSRTNLVIARNTEGLHGELKRLLAGIAGVGLLFGLTAIGTIVVVLRRGLRPLDRLGGQVKSIDTRSLATRFETGDLPPELVPIARRLNNLLSRLEDGFERERRFSSDLAHEFRTPVAELRSMAEVALKWPDPERAGEKFQHVLATSERLQQILEDLLQLARWESGSLEIEKQNVSVAEAARESWEPCRDLAEARGIAADFSIEPDLTLNTSPSLLALILGNLLQNASDYSPDGSSIRVAATGDDETGFELTVSNPAPDFDPEAVPRLFERFWRGESARSERQHAGLGLSLARTCAQILTLELDASWKTGTLTFRLRQPGGLKTEYRDSIQQGLLDD